jgi:sugar phosphate isomerase/epimerase
MLRRDFLATLAAAPAGGYRALVGAQTYVWTQHFARQKKPFPQGIGELFDTTAAAGYRYVELLNTFFEPPLKDRTLALLERHELKVPVVYRGGVMHIASEAEKTTKDILALAEQVKPLGVEAINHNPSPKPKRERKTDAELEVQITAVNRLARELAQRGLRLFVHQHDPEMAENAREWRHILKQGDPKHVEFCLDTHWVYRGGQDPMALLREAGRRIGSLHLRNSRQGVWLEDFREGDIDYRPIAEHLKSIHFRGYVFVELAYDQETSITRPLGESLRGSRLYAERIFGSAAHSSESSRRSPARRS